MYWHPGLAWLDWNANIDTGVIVVIAHFKNHADHAVAHFASSPIKKAHATVGADQAIFDGHAAGADVFPAGEAFAVKELFPVVLWGLGLGGKNQQQE